MPRKGKTVTCPVCGERGTLVIRRRNSNEYAYVRHYKEWMGERRVVEHYAGPVGEYKYATKTHLRDGLVLRGPLDARRVIEYIDRLLDRLEALTADGLGDSGKNATITPSELKAKIRSWIYRLNVVLVNLDAPQVRPVLVIEKGRG